MENINIKCYLDRIGIRSATPLTPDADTLRRLQYAHCTTVPYENLDILSGIPLSLDAADLYNKIVTHHRGGYCFELNGLFGVLLRSLGYTVTDYFARYLRGETTLPMRRHRVLRVDTDGRSYLCDVGIGQSAPKYPLLLEENTPQKQFGETYRFERDGFLGWVLCDYHKGEWRRFFSFTEEPQADIDFAAASFWCERHPTSPFTKSVSLAIKTEGGRITLDGDALRIFDGCVTERVITEAERDGVYLKYFGIKR